MKEYKLFMQNSLVNNGRPRGSCEQGGHGMRGAGQMVYGLLKWSESPFTGSCLSAPGWLNRSGFSLTGWKRQTERRRQEERGLSVYRDLILLLYVYQSIKIVVWAPAGLKVQLPRWWLNTVPTCGHDLFRGWEQVEIRG